MVVSVVGDEVDELGVQGDVAVVEEFADGDVQPVPGADPADGVAAQAGEFTDAQAGADENFADDPLEKARSGLGDAQKLRGGGVVEGLGKGFLLPGQVAEGNGDSGWSLGPVPVVDADEEGAQVADAVGSGVGRPLMLDNRRRTVRALTAAGASSTTAITGLLASLEPVRWAVMNPSTSAAVTSAGAFAIRVKNTFRS